jgi:hypothetical protein
LEIDNIRGLETSTAGGEMVEVRSDEHLVEEDHGILEGQEPHLFDYGGEED